VFNPRAGRRRRGEGKVKGGCRDRESWAEMERRVEEEK